MEDKVKEVVVEEVEEKKEEQDSKGQEKWEKPSLEDVSGKIMAQPYIRFT